MKKHRTNRKDFWKDGLSIDEGRVSILIALLLIFSGFAGYTIFKNGDVPSNVVQIIIALITAVAGVNIADSFANRSNGQIQYTNEAYTTTNTTLERPLDDDQKPTI
ncbi:hypothetical protein D3C76_1172660 [compost metagenome]